MKWTIRMPEIQKRHEHLLCSGAFQSAVMGWASSLIGENELRATREILGQVFGNTDNAIASRHRSMGFTNGHLHREHVVQCQIFRGHHPIIPWPGSQASPSFLLEILRLGRPRTHDKQNLGMRRASENKNNTNSAPDHCLVRDIDFLSSLFSNGSRWDERPPDLHWNNTSFSPGVSPGIRQSKTGNRWTIR